MGGEKCGIKPVTGRLLSVMPFVKLQLSLREYRLEEVLVSSRRQLRNVCKNADLMQAWAYLAHKRFVVLHTSCNDVWSVRGEITT